MYRNARLTATLLHGSHTENPRCSAKDERPTARRSRAAVEPAARDRDWTDGWTRGQTRSRVRVAAGGLDPPPGRGDPPPGRGDPPPGRGDPPHRLGQQSGVGRVLHVRRHHRGVRAHPRRAQQFGMGGSTSLRPFAAAGPQRVVGPTTLFYRTLHRDHGRRVTSAQVRSLKGHHFRSK
jgi:hypothetical protein